MILSFSSSLLRIAARPTSAFTKSFTVSPRRHQWKSLSPSSEPDFSLFEPTDYDTVTKTPALDNSPPCNVLKNMAREHHFVAAREVLGDLRKMGVRIRQSHYYTMAAIERILDNDLDGAMAWIPLLPSRSFHSSHILHVFFATCPTNLDALAKLGESLYLNSNQAKHILAHLTRFSSQTSEVVRYLEVQEKRSSVWHNKRDVLLNQLALTRRFSDLHSVINRWYNVGDSRHQQYVPSAFTVKLVIQEGIKHRSSNKSLLRNAQQLLAEYYPEEASAMAASPSLGPKTSSYAVEQQLAEELTSDAPDDKQVKQLEDELFAGVSLPSAKAIASLVHYYQNDLHTFKVAPRLLELRERLLNREHVKQRAKSLWTFSRMYMQLSNSSQSAEHKKDIKARRALAIFLEVYLPVGIPNSLRSTALATKFQDMSATYRDKSQPLLLWPDPFALGAAYTSLLTIHKNDVDLHNKLWSELMSPPVTTSSRFNFHIPPSMRPDSMTCLPFLHVFSTKHNADRVREGLEDMAATGIPFSIEAVAVLLRAYAARNKIVDVQKVLTWLENEETSFDIPHWTPKHTPKRDIIPHILPFAPQKSQTRAYLEMILDGVDA
ncbi:hypothetical protein E3P99_00236 [Wallemia hederae]|uniref:Uncharacterized protein n=1 Tax=Wallemia hederae TaxID=1540922 RepID=A0A4T0FWN4_9BASI|nr:hypothetical protein E3P99_00236 [Wallemia hederae]